MNYDLIAKDFDTDERIERAKKIADEIRLHINTEHKKSALEYGCGTGLVGFQLIDCFSKLVFTDSSVGMIEQAKQKLFNLGKSKDDAIVADFIAKMPASISVDYIFSSLVLHHIKDTRIILSRFYNILNSDGKLLIIDLDSDDGSFHANHSNFDGLNGFDHSELINLSADIGFRKISAKTFYYGKRRVNDKDVPYSLFILDAMK